MDVDYNGDPIEDRPEPYVMRFEETEPLQFPKNDIGNDDGYDAYFYELPQDRTDWFHFAVIVKLEPGESVEFHTHQEEVEGPVEEIYTVIDGEATIRTEYWDTTLEKFDSVLFPTNAAHQLSNNGSDTLWFNAVVSLGGNEMKADASEGLPKIPGYREEYERILAAREERDLETP